ncbi:hypothetical protein ACJRO7_026518 [Eucalyptus globulus]|uniref:Histidine-containing phosphotransfer protein n=1 Tax=Eucalyptus globulus TaxID=34317 RepID=A0ABD3JS42_EUCGL
MNVGQMQLQRRLVDYKNSPMTEGILDSQYLQLLELQDESNPNLVVEVASLFFTDVEQLRNDLCRELNQQNVDFQRVDVHVDRLEGQSCRKSMTLIDNIVAPRFKDACIAFRHFCNTCQETNIPVYLRCLEHMRQEFLLVKSNIDFLIKTYITVSTIQSSIF